MQSPAVLQAELAMHKAANAEFHVCVWIGNR